MSRSSLSITTHHAHRCTHTKASNKGKHCPKRAQLLHRPVYTCQETKSIRESCPGNMSNTPQEMQAPWHPRACAAVIHKELVLGLLAVRRDQRTPRTGIRASAPRPPTQQKGTILYLTRGGSPGWMVAHGCVCVGGRRWGRFLDPFPPGSRSPAFDIPPRRCTIARCHRCPLRILSGQRKMPRVPVVRILASAPPCALIHPGSPARRACLPGGWLSAKRQCLIPLLRFGFYIARNAMFRVSTGARRGTTTVWVGARGRGPEGGGGRQSQSFLLSTPASPSY